MIMKDGKPKTVSSKDLLKEANVLNTTVDESCFGGGAAKKTMTLFEHQAVTLFSALSEEAQGGILELLRTITDKRENNLQNMPT